MISKYSVRIAFVIIILSFLTLQTANSQTRSKNQSLVPKEVWTMCNDFFKLMMDSSASKAFDLMLKNSPLFREKESVNNMVTQALHTFDLYGPIRGFELADYEEVTSSYVRTRLISIHDIYPVKWVFTFYKSPKVGWIATNIMFEDKTDNLFIAD